MSTDIPPTGNPGQWPSADAINNRIRMSEQANGRRSGLSGMGETFLVFGRKYGINPGAVVALLQRESQLGTDGSVLPVYCNNYGGITSGAIGSAGTCSQASGIHNREWSRFSTPAQGLESTFRLLDTQLYRSTGGKLGDIINKYSPAFENDHDEIFMTFASVGSQLGVTLNRNTNIYTNASQASTPQGESGDSAGMIAGWLTGSLQGVLYRGTLVVLGSVLLYAGIRKLV